MQCNLKTKQYKAHYTYTLYGVGINYADVRDLSRIVKQAVIIYNWMQKSTKTIYQQWMRMNVW